MGQAAWYTVAENETEPMGICGIVRRALLPAVRLKSCVTVRLLDADRRAQPASLGTVVIATCADAVCSAVPETGAPPPHRARRRKTTGTGRRAKERDEERNKERDVEMKVRMGMTEIRRARAAGNVPKRVTRATLASRRSDLR
jgi:hypothetical protein